MFGSFTKGNITFNCYYESDKQTRKGVLVRYWKNKPKAISFYHADSYCRVKIEKIGPLQK
jgi:hypothetical protein